MRRYVTLLDEAAGRELVLPVTPGAYQWTHEANIESVTVDQLGDLNFFGGLRMGSTTLTDCLLPAHAYPFLSPGEQAALSDLLSAWGHPRHLFWGGYEGAELQVLCLEPPDAWQEEPLGFLRLTALAAAGDKLPGHRDYLGSILGLGLDRACLGDLLPDPQEPTVFYAVVLADKLEFISMELTSAGHCPVRTEICDTLPQTILQGQEHELREATVSSLRADAVLAAMMHTSRTRAADYIAAGRVEINHLPLRAAHEPVYARDIFTVRGVGRYRLAEIGGKSRKDRVFISFFQY